MRRFTGSYTGEGEIFDTRPIWPRSPLILLQNAWVNVTGVDQTHKTSTMLKKWSYTPSPPLYLQAAYL